MSAFIRKSEKWLRRTRARFVSREPANAHWE